MIEANHFVAKCSYKQGQNGRKYAG